MSGTETNRLYSYTLYDQIGRITEIGEIKNSGSTAITDSITRSQALLQNWLTASAGNKSQITSTVYDVLYSGFIGISPVPVVQQNLRNRVSYSMYVQDSNLTKFNQGTFYSYDIYGNVDTLLQDYGNSIDTALLNPMNSNNNRFKKMVYRYDLISGKVNHVAYQPGRRDQRYHHYSYDAENRLTTVETSTDSIT